jgi:hypothetical protein
MAAEDAAKYLRAYPDPIPPDTTFETVVSSQPFPPIQYPVPIIGWKHHPEEVHVVPTGALVFPNGYSPRGLYLSLLWSEGGGEPQIPRPEDAAPALMYGYMPGVTQTWKSGDIEITQTAFAVLLEGDEVKTGRETLVALSRYVVANASDKEKSVSLWLHFGEAISGHNMHALPPPYDHGLSQRDGFVVESDGRVSACVLAAEGMVSFQPIPPQKESDRARYVVLNDEASVKQPEYSFDLVRQGDAIAIGEWRSPGGIDFYYEASRIHAVPVALDVEVVAGDGQVTSLGRLYRTGLYTEVRPASEYMAPGQRSPAIPWDALKDAIPQSTSTLRLRAYYPLDGKPALPTSWEPIIYIAQSGVVPRFKQRGSGDARENALRIDLTVAPGEDRLVDLAAPYFPLVNGDALKKLRYSEQLVRFRRFWYDELSRNAEFVVPEQRIQDSYRAALANNLILVDRDPATGLLLPHPDATAYEAVWGGDGSVSIQAMDRQGYHDEAASYLECFLARQGTRQPDGDVDEWDGFFPGDAGPRWLNENGFVLWALAEHYRYSGDKDWLRRVAPKIIKSCEWIARQRARTNVLVDGERPRHWGLLPRGSPSDLGEWDYWYWTDSYTYMGLRRAADVLAEIGMNEESTRFAAEADDYYRCLRDSIERSINHDVSPPFVPQSPYKNAAPTWDYLNAYWYSICGPIYMVESGLIDPKSQEAGWILHWMETLVLYSGLPAFGHGGIDPHYVYNQALAQLLRGEVDKFVWTFYSLFAYGQARTTYATLEGHNLVTGNDGEAWDSIRMPHMHSNSRVLDMVRIALVLERGDELHLLAGTPRGWLADGKRIEIRRAPTYFGDVELVGESHIGKGEIRFEVSPPARRQASVVLHVRPPSQYGRLKSVSVNGKRWTRFTDDAIMLGKISEKTKVVCEY